MLLIAAALLAAASPPMVTAITNFSDKISLSPFYVSFVVTPFVSNASELVAAIIFAAKKRKKNITLT
jgi:Ca2+/H+ antiporter